MATLNNFALGRGVGVLSITSQSPNASTGVLTAGTAKSILGQFKTWKMTQSNSVEDVSATSARAKNNMILDSGTRVEISGILFAADNGTTTNPAAPMVNAYDYISVACTRAGLSVTIYGVVLEYTEEVKDKGSVPFTLSLGEIDINGTNPAFA